jgi:predicted DNA-binding transcriptional regulator YafY
MLDMIKRAISERKTLTIDYPPGVRTIEPHCLGWSADNNMLLRAYQTDGASASGKQEHWKLLRTDRIRGVSESGKGFAGPRPLYNPDDKAMKGGIIARL